LGLYSEKGLVYDETFLFLEVFTTIFF
jgi:hypothetical protein